MNIQNRQKLSEIIKTARGTMSQRAFGKLLGVSATAVQLWERGDRQSFVYGWGYINYNEMNRLMKSHPAYKELPAKVSQQICE